jgi:hypothetical protein
MLQIGELHNLYPSPKIIRMIKSVRMRLAARVTRIGLLEIRNELMYKIFALKN